MIFVRIQYLRYSNGWDIIFEWHTWMVMFNTKKLHNFIQNYIIIIVWIWLKCKSYIFHIQTSQVKNTYHLYKSKIYIFHAIFTLWSPWMLHKHIILWFLHGFYCKFVVYVGCNSFLHQICTTLDVFMCDFIAAISICKVDFFQMYSNQTFGFNGDALKSISINWWIAFMIPFVWNGW
jgi:hypothetical protein